MINKDKKCSSSQSTGLGAWTGGASELSQPCRSSVIKTDVNGFSVSQESRIQTQFVNDEGFYCVQLGQDLDQLSFRNSQSMSLLARKNLFRTLRTMSSRPQRGGTRRDTSIPSPRVWITTRRVSVGYLLDLAAALWAGQTLGSHAFKRDPQSKGAPSHFPGIRSRTSHPRADCSLLSLGTLLSGSVASHIPMARWEKAWLFRSYVTSWDGQRLPKSVLSKEISSFLTISKAEEQSDA